MRNKKSLGNKVICVIFAKSMMQLKENLHRLFFLIGKERESSLLGAEGILEPLQ